MSFGSTGKIPKPPQREALKSGSNDYYDDDGFSEDEEEESSSKDGVKREAFNLDAITDNQVTPTYKANKPVGVSDASAEELSSP